MDRGGAGSTSLSPSTAPVSGHRAEGGCRRSPAAPQSRSPPYLVNEGARACSTSAVRSTGTSPRTSPILPSTNGCCAPASASSSGLVSDHRYFARPSRTLFTEIRWCFPLAAQRHVYQIIDGHLSETRAALRTDNDVAYELSGVRPRCRASTRRGTGCGHEPDPRTGYCAWHRHLADDEDFALTA